MGAEAESASVSTGTSAIAEVVPVILVPLAGWKVAFHGSLHPRARRGFLCSLASIIVFKATRCLRP